MATDTLCLVPELKRLAKWRADGTLYEVIVFHASGRQVFHEDHPEWARVAQETGPWPGQG